MALGDRVGGHLVLGHVDGIAEVLTVEPQGEMLSLRLALPAGLLGYVAPKGSIAVDGISLTVTDSDAAGFGVGIIPHTMRETTLRAVKPGMFVNLEVDVLARYVVQTLRALGPTAAIAVDESVWGARQTGDRTLGAGGLTEDVLREHGFA